MAGVPLFLSDPAAAFGAEAQDGPFHLGSREDAVTATQEAVEAVVGAVAVAQLICPLSAVLTTPAAARAAETPDPHARKAASDAFEGATAKILVVMLHS